jgi:hypothetical protein
VLRANVCSGAQYIGVPMILFSSGGSMLGASPFTVVPTADCSTLLFSGNMRANPKSMSLTCGGVEVTL